MFCNTTKSQSFWAYQCIGILDGLAKVDLYVAGGRGSEQNQSEIFILMRSFLQIVGSICLKGERNESPRVNSSN